MEAYRKDGVVQRSIQAIKERIDAVKSEEQESVKPKAAEIAEERILDILLPPKPAERKVEDLISDRNLETHEVEQEPQLDTTREKMRRLLREGKLDNRYVDLEIQESRSGPMIEVFTSSGIEDMGLNIKEMFGNIFPQKKKRARVKVPEAREILENEEAQRLSVRFVYGRKVQRIDKEQPDPCPGQWQWQRL
jgi:ATP-dependent HslUV protease ATP-binding subunit HslU